MPRFTIRDVLWLTVVVALGLCLGLERWRIAEDRDYWRDHSEKLDFVLVDTLRNLDAAEAQARKSIMTRPTSPIRRVAAQTAVE